MSAAEHPCHLLALHSLDVAAVAASLVRRWPGLRRLLTRQLPLTEAQLEGWVAFWIALHDLGKFAQSFQSQCPDLFVSLRARAPDPARPYTRHHDSLGLVFWNEVLRERVVAEEWLGRGTDELAYGLDAWVRSTTGHHGEPPQAGDAWTQHFRPRDDGPASETFVDAVRRLFLTDDTCAAIARLDPSASLGASKQLSWWLAGLTVLADWLGSNTLFFPYESRPQALDAYWLRALRQAEAALSASGVLPPARLPATGFGALFPSLPAPSPLQQWAATQPLAPEPQIHLLEDVTSAGKTEAALMLTHRLMAADLADGFYIALPTMATAHAMYGRLASAYGRMFADAASLVLATGQRDLVESFARSVLPADHHERDPRQTDQTASAGCAAWLADHRKRALLSPAGVGTIDQALLAVL